MLLYIFDFIPVGHGNNNNFHNVDLLSTASLFVPQVDSEMITVNNDGDISIECCVNGTCLCGSLYYVLQNLIMTSNSIINITSESVTLHTTTPIGSGNLHNVTITGRGGGAGQRASEGARPAVG